MPDAFPTPPATPSRPSRDTAFVVHLATAPATSAGHAHGRVEHVASGRTSRFGSADELVRFMQDTLAAIAADGH